TMAWAADGHNHFHIQDLQRFKLQTLGAKTLLNVAKTGFCFRDSYWYGSTIAFQWIDITGLASGDYLIKIVADPPWETGGRFLESNESNNRSWAKIHL